MYILTYNDQVFLGPMKWHPRMFIAVIEDDYDLIVSIPTSNPDNLRYDVNAEIVIRPMENGIEPTFNSKTQDLQGPIYDIQLDKVILTYTVRDLPIELVKGQLRERVKNNRKRKEIEGIVVNVQGDDVNVSTASEDREPFDIASRRGGITMDWKFGDNNWKSVTPAELSSIADAINQHIEDQYTWEYNKNVEINALTLLSELDLVDVGDPVEAVPE